MRMKPYFYLSMLLALFWVNASFASCVDLDDEEDKRDKIETVTVYVSAETGMYYVYDMDGGMAPWKVCGSKRRGRMSGSASASGISINSCMRKGIAMNCV